MGFSIKFGQTIESPAGAWVLPEKFWLGKIKAMGQVAAVEGAEGIASGRIAGMKRANLVVQCIERFVIALWGQDQS